MQTLCTFNPWIACTWYLYTAYTPINALHCTSCNSHVCRVCVCVWHSWALVTRMIRVYYQPITRSLAHTIHLSINQLFNQLIEQYPRIIRLNDTASQCGGKSVPLGIVRWQTALCKRTTRKEVRVCVQRWICLWFVAFYSIGKCVWIFIYGHLHIV